jgi:hypothetical protein
MSPRPVAGVVVSDSKLTRDVTELVKNMKSPLLFHHPSRVYYWGALTGKYRASKVTGRFVCETVQWECVETLTALMRQSQCRSRRRTGKNPLLGGGFCNERATAAYKTGQAA